MSEPTAQDEALAKIALEHAQRMQQMRQRFIETGTPLVQDEDNDSEPDLEGGVEPT